MQINKINLINDQFGAPGAREQPELAAPAGRVSGSPGWPCGRQGQRPYQPEAHPREHKQEKQCKAPAKVQHQNRQTGEECLQIGTGNS